jgi:hypothetical protein
MGYYAQSEWNLTIKTSVFEVQVALRDYFSDDPYGDAFDDSKSIFQYVMWQMNEEAECTVQVKGGVASWTGWGSGKCLSAASDDGVWALLAQHCVGTVDWHGEDDTYSRIRLYGNGEFREFAGEVVYPLDTAALVGA